MGEFNVTGPDKKVYRVTVPEGATQDQAIEYVQKKYYGGGGAQQPTAEDGFWNTVKGLGEAGISGLAGGLEGALGLPGDVERGVDWLADKTAKGIGGALGLKPKRSQEEVDKRMERAGHAFPTSGEVGDVVQKATTATMGEEAGKVASGRYEPKHWWESYLKTGAEFLPGAALPGGEASLLRRLTLYGLVPAAASETAGQFTKGGPWETAARIATGLAAGAGTAAFDRAGAIAAASHDQIEARASQLYDAFDRSGHRINARSFQDEMIAMGRELYSQGLARNLPGTSDNVHGRLWNAFITLTREGDRIANAGGSIPLTAIQRWRRILKAPGGDFNNPDMQRLTAVARDHLDRWIQGLRPQDIVGGADPRLAVRQLQAAQRLWHVNRKMDLINDVLNSAELRGYANYTQAGWQTAAKQLFKNLALDRKRFAAFSPDEQEAITNIVRLGPTEWITRLLGKMAIRGQVSLIGMLHVMGAAGAGLHAFGLPGIVGGAAAAGIGEATRAISHGITHAKVNDMSELVRRGAGMGGRAPPRARGAANPAFWGGQATGAGGAIVQWHGLKYRRTPDGRLELIPGQSLTNYNTNLQ